MKRTNFKKAVCVVIVAATILSFASCSFCRHEWSPATCTEAGNCRLCGRIDKSSPATGHQFKDATCSAPKTCMVCGETEGEKLSHTYEDGYCVECHGKDPDFVDLNKLGFITTYGMTEWVHVYGYDFYEHRVTVYSDVSFTVFNGNYYQGDSVYQADLKEVTKIDASTLNLTAARTYSVVSNDVLQFYDGSTWTINKRQISTVDSDDKNMILKTTQTRWNSAWSRYDSYEEWYVPADFLDFSTITPGEGKDANKYYIYFKE